SGTLLSDYDSSTSCSLNGAAATATNSASLTYGDKLDCTITNKRLPRLKITKALDPGTDGGKFDLLTDTAPDTNGGLGYGNGGDPSEHNGSPAAGALAHTGTGPSDYDSQATSDSSKGDGAAGATTHSFTAGYGDKVICTITNHRKAQVKVVKQLDPSLDGG